MAKIVREIDDINNITGLDFLAEIEYIEFVDEKGISRKFKITGIVPLSVDDCRRIDKEVDWDGNNFHVVVDCGQEVK